MDNINVTPQFVLAGDAELTVSNGAGRHYTIKVYKAEPTAQFPNPAYFVKMLTGSNNESDSTYIGILKFAHGRDPQVVATGRSKMGPADVRMKVANWAMRVIWHVAKGDYQLPVGYTIQHVGKCGRCGRKLSTPASLDTGLGPECAAMAGVEWAEREQRQPVLEGARFG